MKNINDVISIVARVSIIAVLLALSSLAAQAGTQIDIAGPAGSSSFGTTVAVLPNGNVVVTDPIYDITTPGFVSDVGAVYLYDGKSGNLISQLTGSCQNDNVGSGGVKVLNNGRFLISSPNLDLVSATGTQNNNCAGSSNVVIRDAGAVTMGEPATGVSGPASASNSLVGSKLNDQVSGTGFFVLPNGNFIITSSFWGDQRGAVTFGNGNAPLTGQVSELNSLTGSHGNDYLGRVTILSNNNYIVHSPSWNLNSGSVTLCSGSTGCAGLVSSSNSLVGSPGDSVGNTGVVSLPNGNYLVQSYLWNGKRGAVTFGNGTTGVTGLVSGSNSLVGNTVNDFVGNTPPVTVLSNGNYVVVTSSWDNGAVTNAGAATFGDGATGVSGFISPANSLVGSRDGDFYISRTIALSNGNYVVFLPRWNAPPGEPGGAAVFGNGTTGATGTISTSNSLTSVNESGGVTALTNGNYVITSPGWNNARGAVTFCDGTTGTFGTVSAANSLIGTDEYDRIGENGVTALSNGNYVVNSSSWSSRRGASTFCSGAVGCGGTVSAANSLTGGNPSDKIGNEGATALTNGNYVVRSLEWNNYRGAVTFGNGTTGITGVVGSSNSLIGSNPYEAIGNYGVVPLPNGNYLIVSSEWNQKRGGVTWGSGASGVSGEITAENSLIGSTPGDLVGAGRGNPSVTVFKDGSYVVRSDYWNNGAATEAGAISLGKANTPLVGTISSANSVRGTAQSGGSRLSFDYSSTAKQLAVGHPTHKYFSIFRYNIAQTTFDFDGDSKADLSLFRPSTGVWHLLNSTAGYREQQFANPGDKPVPADYDGDGKTDIAVYRPSTGVWYILRSQLGFTQQQFGGSDFNPVPSDYDGDGKADLAVYRPSTGVWHLLQSTAGYREQQFGGSAYQPVFADYDGDKKTDVAVYLPSNGFWYILRSQAGYVNFQFGGSGYKPVVGDYDGDEKADVAVYLPSNGVWYMSRSRLGYKEQQFGGSGYQPVPADYDGDGKADIAVYLPSNGTWYLLNTATGYREQQFGDSDVTPVPSSFLP